MDDFTTAPLETLVTQAYTTAFTAHGDLGLKCREYSTHLYSIIERRMGVDPLPAACEFVNHLHLSDLYLALACALGSETAWGRFALSYGSYIRKVSVGVCRSREMATDLADSLLGHVFLPDATGRSRIASFEGLSPLSAWLASVIKHRAFNEHRLKAISLESLDLAADKADESSINKAEAEIRAGRYRRLISDSLEDAVSLLSDRERIILRLRYGQEMQVSQVARLLDVKPPAISRQIDRTKLKLREHVVSILSTKHRLGPAVIQDCLAHLVENPEPGILDFS
jgi:RNA polymerase sigma-70 factor